MERSVNRIAFATAQYGFAVLEGLRTDRTLRIKPKTAKQAVEMLLVCDPSRNAKDKPGRYLPWLCQAYQREWKAAKSQGRDHTMLAEDFARIESYLTEYETLKIKGKLPADKRDIGGLSFGELKDVVINARGRVQEIPVSDEDLRQSTILYNGAAGIVVVPHSISASRAWGRGTEWCTSAGISGNQFQSYNKDGPLIIFKTESGQKYQTHTKSVLMNAHDVEAKELPRALLDSMPEELRHALINHSKTELYSPVKAEPHYFEKDFSDRNCVLQMLRQEPEFMEYTNPELCSDINFLLEAIEINYEAVLLAGYELRADAQFMLEAVKRNGLAVMFASWELQIDPDIALAAVQQNGHALQHVRGLKADANIVLAAVRQNGEALQWATQGDRNIVLEAVRQNGQAFYYLKNANPLRNDFDIVLEAVQQNGMVLEHASKFWNNPDIVIAAVGQNAGAVQYPDDEFKTDDFMMQAVEENIQVIEFCEPDFVKKIPPSVLYKGFQSNLPRDWRAIAYLHDAGASLNVAQELEVFERGLADKKNTLMHKHLHLFPSLRENGAFMSMNLQEAHICLRAMVEPEVIVVPLRQPVLQPN